MGTNFYARIIPTKERKEKLKKLIDEDDFSAIKEEVGAMYATIGEYCHEGGVVHIGKRSGGWKFLWNPNWYEEDNGHYDTDTKEWIPNPTIKKFYDLNRASILEFLKRDDVRLFDEYGEEYDPEEFMNEMQDSQYIKVPLVGVFSAGKSSLLNVFTQKNNMLPVDTMPETAVAYELYYAQTECVELYRNGKKIDSKQLSDIKQLDTKPGDIAKVYCTSEPIRQL